MMEDTLPRTSVLAVRPLYQLQANEETLNELLKILLQWEVTQEEGRTWKGRAYQRQQEILFSVCS